MIIRLDLLTSLKMSDIFQQINVPDELVIFAFITDKVE